MTMSQMIKDQFIPEGTKRRLGMFKVYYTSEFGKSRIAGLFNHMPLIEAERSLYVFPNENILNNKNLIPTGFHVQQIDKNLLSSNLKNIQDVISEIESCWNTLKHFLDKGFGFCLLNNNEVACWCTAEYVSDGRCGIGIETVEQFMNRGFATLTTNAFLEYCVSNQIAAHWDSWKANLPSIKVAEKVGFKKELDYSVFLGKFPESA